MPINFDQLMAKTIRAPYVPNVKDELDLKHISPSFYKEPFNPGKDNTWRTVRLVLASLVPENLATTRREHDFEQFTFTAEPTIR